MNTPSLSRPFSSFARRVAGLAVATGVCLGAVLSSAQAADKLTVFAAASMKDALTAIGDLYKSETGTEVVFSFASSSVVARQITAGAPADIFVSADVKWMDYVSKAEAIEEGTARIIAGNSLVVVAPVDEAKPLALEKEALLQRIGDGHLAIGSPEAVPAGRYAKASLTSLGLWDAVEGKLVHMENVRVTLASVARGEVALGIVYGSDAAIEPRVAVVATFPDDSHAPIVYPAGLVKGAGAEAAGFLEYLSSPAAREVFARLGFKSGE
ncbi:molybdate ABC transporter substrate-binding protein [Breoghania sp.]|uniref:molybdate ABC transporter substrate-binding protein n=1 Tax=Breoghania sp. TaxID=2065378 RepID=UPI002AAA9312|nr:molybdate ABC transporter substrate-binding protein [Breoghania sp.]